MRRYKLLDDLVNILARPEDDIDEDDSDSGGGDSGSLPTSPIDDAAAKAAAQNAIATARELHKIVVASLGPKSFAVSFSSATALMI